jgi:hypothetical protein
LRSRAALLAYGGCEPPFDLLWVDAGQFDDLVPGAVARNDGDGATRNRECFGKQADDGVIRTPVFRRRSDTHLPRITVPADDACAFRSGRDAQP